ncbi:MAG: hypothetical protein ACKVHO_17560 [Verrucomicrobiia bacterium]|jgi:hypothetical protein
MKKIQFPLVVHSAHAFFDESGCEEFDFEAGLKVIFDCTGHEIEHDKRTATIERTDTLVSKETIVSIFAEHFQRLSRKSPSEFRDAVSGLTLTEVIRVGLEWR